VDVTHLKLIAGMGAQRVVRHQLQGHGVCKRRLKSTLDDDFHDVA
jgi:hypothetical protein